MTTEQSTASHDAPDSPDDTAPRSAGMFARAPYLGLVGALLFFWASLTPTLLPRGPVFQGAVSGGSAVIGYGIGILVALFLRWLLEWEPPRLVQRVARWVLTVVAVAGTVAMLVWFAHWQSQLRTIMSADPLRWWAYPLTLVIAVIVWAVIIAVCRGFRWLARLLTRLGRGFLPRRVAAVAGVVLAGWLVVTLANGVLANWLMSGLNSSFSAINDETEADSAPPDTPLRSGSAASLVTWDSLGRLGRRFVSDGPTVEQIAQFTGRPAIEPIRVYAGLASTDGGVVERAQRVVDELERTGALDRKVIAVANTTGSGWINEASATSLEYMFGGDTAIASMQYSYLPSWLSFIADQSRARQAGQALFRAVAAEVQSLPEDQRPRLVTFGESLGSFSGESAFSGDLDLASQTDGALFVGPTSNNELWRRFTAQRDEGSPEWLPIYREGMTVRFISDAEDLQRPDTPWEGTRVVYLQHASDPITWWNPDTLLSEPDWLDEPRGDAVLPSTQWYPIITFLQLSADMAVGTNVPDGFGHTFVADYADAWAAILQLPQWTDDDTRRLRKVLAE
nr:alpha/beta-hydrolase family protein [Tomitella gaofuii]